MGSGRHSHRKSANALAKLRTLMTVNEISPENKKLFCGCDQARYAQFEPSIGKDFLDQCICDLG